jgi:esterase/lipase
MRLLGSTDKTLVVLPRSHHIVTRDYDKDTLRRALSGFFTRVAARQVISA